MDMVYTNLPHEHKIVIYIVELSGEEIVAREMEYVEQIKASLTPPKCKLVEIEDEEGGEELKNRAAGTSSRGMKQGIRNRTVRRLCLPSTSGEGERIGGSIVDDMTEELGCEEGTEHGEEHGEVRDEVHEGGYEAEQLVGTPPEVEQLGSTPPKAE